MLRSYMMQCQRLISIDVSFEKVKRVIEPAVNPIQSLEQLLAQVTEDNLPCEVDTGSALGGEEW
jgi:hypothetical protein